MNDTGILDTNTVILLPRLLSTGQALPIHSLITSITLAELSAGPLATNDPTEIAERLIRLQHAESDFGNALPFDEAAARAFAQVSADLRAAGRKPSARAFDSLIASIAIANGLPLYTINPKDFVDINHLQLVSVPHPGRPQ